MNADDILAIEALAPGATFRIALKDPRSKTHRVLVVCLAERAFHTDRPRYLVACLSCNELEHEATTGPESRIESHLARDNPLW